MNPRIYITGRGVVSAIGLNKQECLRSLQEGRTGIGPLRYLCTSHHEFPVGEVPLSDEEMIQRLRLEPSKPSTRTQLMGIMALKEALEEASLDPARCAASFISGTTVGGMDKSERYYLDFLEGDLHKEYIDTHDCGACSEMIADYFGSFERIASLSTACSSAANALIMGAELIQSGQADIVVAGGSECITKFHLNGFNTLMILDRQNCRPFDQDRAGLNLGEGAAYIVLESEASRQRRGVKPVAVLEGWGNACDAFHQTASSPDGEGAFRSMTKAIERAGLHAADIDYINAHGTGTPNNDLSESAAIVRLFGEHYPPVSSTKSMTGHTTSASGSIEAVFCTLALEHQFLPGNYAWSTPMENGIVPIAVPGRPERPLRHILCNAFGFGGNDSSLILGLHA